MPNSFLKEYNYRSPHARNTSFFLYYKMLKRLPLLLGVAGVFLYLSLLGNIPFHHPENGAFNEPVASDERQSQVQSETVEEFLAIKGGANRGVHPVMKEPVEEKMALPATPRPDSIPVHRRIEGQLRRNESFSMSMKRHKVPEEILKQIIDGFRPRLNFKRLLPHDTYVISLDEHDRLIRCTFESGPLASYVLERSGDGFSARQEEVHLERKTLTITGTVENSLFTSFMQFEEHIKLIYAFADIFASKIDFNTESRDGDRFTLTYEKYYKDNDFIGYGKILYARYEQALSANVLEGYYFTHPDGSGYFDNNGQELSSSFIKSPVPVGRISSRFSTRRKHPILGIVRPHLGVDLAAPRGTPVMAAADGIVKSIGTNGGFGKQVVLQHADGYESYYGHLARFKKGLRRGSKVSQKEVIGYVGSTGLATGPHLDYRIQHRGIFKNPFNMQFKPKTILTGTTLARFNKQMARLAAPALALAERAPNLQVVRIQQVTITSENDIYLL